MSRNAKQGDIGGTLSNVLAVPLDYVHLAESVTDKPAKLLGFILSGASNGLKGKNLLDDVTGLLRGATGGAVTGLQYAMADDVGHILTSNITNQFVACVKWSVLNF